MVYKLFDKKASGSGIKNEIISNKELAEESHKPIIRKLKKGNYTQSLLTMLVAQKELQLLTLFRKF